LKKNVVKKERKLKKERKIQQQTVGTNVRVPVFNAGLQASD
jgi:hypothetical protein